MDHALDQYSVIAYYGTSGDIKDRERFYRTAVGLFRELGYPPDKIGITGKGYAERMRKFAMGDARLSKTGFAGVRAVEIVASLPDAVTGGDYHLRGVVSFRRRFRGTLVNRCDFRQLDARYCNGDGGRPKT